MRTYILKVPYLAIAGFFVLATSACSIYYKTDNIIPQLNTAISQISSSEQQIKTDYVKQTDLYNKLKSSFGSSQFAKTGIPQHHAAMTQHWHTIQSLSLNARQQLTRFKAQIPGSGQIDFGSPQHKSLNTLQNHLRNDARALENSAKQYSQASKSFVSAINKSGIQKLDISALNQQITLYKKELSRANSDMEETRKLIKGTSWVLDNDWLAAQRSFSKLKARQSVLSAYQQSLQKMVSGNILWVAPGMKSHELYSKLLDEADAINNMASTIQGHISALNVKRASP